ncbi:TraB/GumN family protein [Marinimicrobium agarilyticum]|uniref:TraB/GumN family protein n=1 Tax=Marinimicrobium agarilyticum TaxID=306546 RepID=UPI0003FE524E|nr:TraB/GumN family protein [Marinimicrobium agarilyticum]
MTTVLRATGAALALLFTLSAHASTTLFEVSKGGQRILLGGTIHLLHPTEFPLPAEFDAAYEEADALYLEADMAQIQDPAFSQQMMQLMLYPPGKSLSTELSAEVWESLARYSKQNQFPIQQFVGFDPAFVSMMMTVMTAQQKGITKGVDTHYFNRAKADNKPTGQLESTQAVLGYMKALAGHDGDEIIKATLRDLRRFDQMMETTVSAWKAGDMDTLYRDLGKPMKEEAPEMYQTLMVERNKDWLPVIKGLFEDEAVELVLVGSLHLAGEDSLLEQLEKAGYRVKSYTIGE